MKFFLVLLTGFIGSEPVSPGEAKALRLDQIQVVGTHNSYHQAPKPQLLQLSTAVNPEAASWAYSHATLDVQLDRGVRSFELDLHWVAGEWQVFHVPILDAGTSCLKLADAFRTIRQWSEKHPRHIPISVLMEVKSEGPMLDKRIRHPDAQAIENLESLVVDSFPSDRLLTPDDVRREEETLESAVKTHRWPTLGQCAGKVMVILHETGTNRDFYTEGHEHLQGRAMFVNSSPGQAFAATLVMDSPTNRSIPDRVRDGYFIRTRADAREPVPSSKRRDLALSTGAHILSTDYPAGEIETKIGYVLAFEDNAPARVNPVSGPEGLRERTIREPIP